MTISSKNRPASLRRWGASLLAATATAGILATLPMNAAVAAEHTTSASTGALTPADEALARRFAPQIWLQQDESYFPSSVDWWTVMVRAASLAARASSP
jgi:hypothetical protein